MVNLSWSAQQAIAGIRLDVRDAAASDMAYDDLKPLLDGLCNRLAAVVTADLAMNDARPCVESSDQKEQ